VKAVEIGRGLYDNLTQYVRFQMGVLFRPGRHVPRRGHLQRGRRRSRFVPLQTFVDQLHHARSFQAIGLGYGQARGKA